MKFHIETDKKAIKSGEVFEGLAVHDLAYYRKLFLADRYELVSVSVHNVRIGHAIYEKVNGEVLFHLINCRPAPGGVIAPLTQFIKDQGYSAINANVERPAMGLVLEKLGFNNMGGGLYRAESL